MQNSLEYSSNFSFFLNRLNPKIKNSTINNNYENGGLKNVNIATKVSSF